jgi:hypothetical protein
MLAEFDIFNQNKNQFLVFGRKYQNKFIELKDVQLPDPISGLFKGFGEDIFREDISSSSIRQENTEE